MKKHSLLTLFYILIYIGVSAQTGLTVGPPRVYFVANPGQSQTQYVDVTNPSKDYPLELAVSLEDWKYSLTGDNELYAKGTLPTSLANWLSISENYFSLKPGETKRLQVQLQVPSSLDASDTTPVHTNMLFITQLNPRVSQQNESGNIRLAVRSGIKLYHKLAERNKIDVEISDLAYHSVDTVGQYLEISYDVASNTWVEGLLQVEFLHEESGLSYKVPESNFYCLPGDKRKQYILLPTGMKAGSYVATTMLFYGENHEVKIAEIEFNYELLQ